MVLNLADNLSFLLKSYQLNQTDLADITGKSRSTAGAYVRGDASPPADILVMIASHFGITLDELVLRDLAVENKYGAQANAPSTVSMSAEPSHEYKSAVQTDVDWLKTQHEFFKEQLEMMREHITSQRALIEELQRNKE